MSNILLKYPQFGNYVNNTILANMNIKLNISYANNELIDLAVGLTMASMIKWYKVSDGIFSYVAGSIL